MCMIELYGDQSECTSGSKEDSDDGIVTDTPTTVHTFALDTEGEGCSAAGDSAGGSEDIEEAQRAIDSDSDADSIGNKTDDDDSTEDFLAERISSGSEDNNNESGNAGDSESDEEEISEKSDEDSSDDEEDIVKRFLALNPSVEHVRKVLKVCVQQMEGKHHGEFRVVKI